LKQRIASAFFAFACEISKEVIKQTQLPRKSLLYCPSLTRLSFYHDESSLFEVEGLPQKIINHGQTSVNYFRLLSENKPIVKISRSSYQDTINATFFHALKKASVELRQ